MNIGSEALVQVCAKGFSITERSGEFQRVVPSASLEIGELDVGALLWSEVLTALHDESEQSLGAQFALMFIDDVAVLVVAHATEDNYRRPSFLVVAGTIRVDWTAGNLADRLARLSSLLRFLASNYASTFRSGDSWLEEQLRTNGFLPNRRFDLDGSPLDEKTSWVKLVEEVAKWRGVKGIATPALVGLGANVLCGTRFEAERYGRGRLDGFIDATSYALSPFGTQLERWNLPSDERREMSEPPPDPVVAMTERIQTLESQFKAFETRVDEKLDSGFERIVAAIREMFRVKKK